jgi:hypothetical protein
MPTATNQSYQSPWGNGLNNNPGWSGPPFWHPAGIGKPLIIAGIVFLVVAGHLGRMLFWPLAVAGIVFMMVSGRCSRRRWAQNQWGQNANQDQSGNGGGWQSCVPPWGRWWNFGGANGGGGGNQQRPPSSGNHAFDEYRAETLRRLEDEQKDFSSFLERLRFAKDKAEFDQFMADRRHTPTPPAPMPEQPPA